MAPVLVGAYQSPRPVEERPGDFLGEQLFAEFHEVVFGAAHPTTDSLQQQVFERGFVERASDRGTQRAHELVGSEFEIAGAMSVESAG